MRGFKYAGFAAASAVLLCAATLASDTPGERFGGQFQIDSSANGVQRGPAVASNAYGGITVAWQDATSDPNLVLVRRYSALGEPFSGEISIGAGQNPAVAMNATAGFVVVYTRNNVLRYALYDNEAQLIREDVVDAAASAPRPVVAMDADGNFATSYFKVKNGAAAVVTRRFDVDGNAVGGDIVTTFNGGDCQEPVIAMGADGRFVVACIMGISGSVRTVHAQLYNNAGNPVGNGFFQASGETSNTMSGLHAAMDAVGNFVLVWSIDPSRILGHFFLANGNQDGAEFQVASTTEPSGLVPGGVAMSALGDTVVVWDTRGQGKNQPTGSDVFERRYSRTRDAFDAVKVNTATPRPHLHQLAPSVALDADGDFVVVWQDGDGDLETNILGQRFVGPENVDLALNITDSPDPAAAGEQLTYLFTVSNLHASVHPIPGASEGIDKINQALGSAHNVDLVATLPPGSGTLTQGGSTDWGPCEFVSASNSLHCSFLEILAPGGSSTVTARRSAPTSGSSATANGLVDAYQLDTAMANNADSETTTLSGNQPTVQFATATSSAAESAGTVHVTVTLSAAATTNVTVNFAVTTASTATSPADYTVTTTSPLTIPAGQQSASIDVAIVDDTVSEPSETVVLQLSAPSSNATLGTPSTHVLTITDNEVPAPPTVQFHQTAENAPEAGGAVAIVLDLSAPSTQNVTVNFIVGGTATPTTDYTIAPSGGTVTIPAGQQHATITVTPVNDTVDEFDETVALTLTSATNATLGSNVHNTVTIQDDDASTSVPAVQFEVSSLTTTEGGSNVVVNVRLSEMSTQTVSVQFAVGGSATNHADFEIVSPTTGTVTFAPGSNVAAITIALPEDAVAEPSETLVLTLSSPTNATLGSQTIFTLTILDNDAGGVGSNSVTIHSAAEDKDVTFTTSQGKFTALSVVEAPNNPPAGLEYPLGFFAYVISDVAPNTVLTLTVTVPTGSNITDWVDCIENSCYRYTKDPSPDPGQATIGVDQIVVKIQDQGPGDNDPRPGFVSSKVAPATPPNDNGGSMTWLLLMPMFGAAAWRRRRTWDRR